VGYKRKVDETALNIVYSKEFQARIWMLIEDVELI